MERRLDDCWPNADAGGKLSVTGVQWSVRYRGVWLCWHRYMSTQYALMSHLTESFLCAPPSPAGMWATQPMRMFGEYVDRQICFIENNGLISAMSSCPCQHVNCSCRSFCLYWYKKESILLDSECKIWNFNLMVVCAESVQQSLEKKFGKAGGTIPITPSDLFEKRMGVSIDLML